MNQAVFDWCFSNAEQCLRQAALEKSLQWTQLAALIHCRAPFEYLSSPKLETHLIEIAARLPGPTQRPASRDATMRRWLHVLTKTGSSGGHNAIVRRWVDVDGTARRHSVALLEHDTEVPGELRQAICTTGGDVLKMPPPTSLMERAVRLRAASMGADVVVLHVHPYDIIPVVAFGVSGGPPVLFLNHADHSFWVGGSVADAVLNLRESGLEWIARIRGTSRLHYLPRPLPSPPSVATVERREAAARRRNALGVPLDVPVLLTSGEAYKYKPLPGHNFFDAARAILDACPSAYLVAIGPGEAGDWKALRDATGGRVRAVGLQTDVSPYYAMADVYLEGFPFGSNTAFLEACVQGIPCVTAPRGCPPLLGSDGVAPEQLERPTDLFAYVRTAIRFVTDEAERHRYGVSLASATRERHTGSGWLERLRAVEAGVPRIHSVYPISAPEPIPPQFADVWAQFEAEWHGNEDPFSSAYRHALRLGLTPRLDGRLVKTLRSARHTRGNNAAHELLLGLLDPLVSLLPAKTWSRIYDGVISHLCHDGRVLSAFRRSIAWSGKRNDDSRNTAVQHNRHRTSKRFDDSNPV